MRFSTLLLATALSLPACAGEKPKPAQPPKTADKPAEKPAEPPAPPENTLFHIYSWNYGRARKTVTGSNRVSAEFMLKNLSGKDQDIEITLQYKTGLGEEAAKPLQKKVGLLKADEAQKITIVEEFIPNFNGYDITLHYGDGKKEEWFSTSDTGQPQPRSGEPIQGVASLVVVGKEAAPDRQGRFAGTVRVKNEGTAEAKNMKVVLTFYDTKKNKMGDWSGKLGEGVLAGGAEDNFKFVMPVAPRYAAYELKVTCDDTSAEKALSGGDFTTAKEIEFAKFQLNRPDAKSKALDIKAAVRNGLDEAVQSVKLTMIFTGAKKKEVKRFEYTVPGTLKPGEIKPVSFKVDDLPSYEGYEQSVAYETAPAPTPAGDKPAVTTIKAAKFQNKPEVEVIFTDAATGDDKAVTFVGGTRNGLQMPIKDLAITLSITPATGEVLKVEKVLTDVIKPGEERSFVIKATNAAAFKTYSYAFKYATLESGTQPKVRR